MLNRRQCKRVRECVDVEFVSDGKSFIGTSDDFSLNGLFIMTQDVKAPGTVLDIIVHLPDGSILKLRGKVNRCLKTFGGEGIGTPDGMGIEIIEKDGNYLNFYRSLLATSEKDSSTSAHQMDGERMQQPHKVPTPEDQSKECMEEHSNLNGKSQQSGRLVEEQERHCVPLNPENKKSNNKSFDDMLFELVSKKLKP